MSFCVRPQNNNQIEKDDANNTIIHDEIEELEDAIAEYLKKEISGKREDETRNDTEKLTQTLDTVLLHQDSWIVSKVRKEYGTQTYIRVLFCENTTLAEVYKSRNFTFYTQFTETLRFTLNSQKLYSILIFKSLYP